eukprot:CAMPEP_0184862560 /NCGR_PEP_ID=MMETSP0580-20130426/7009_1 /TAXON_ID=1118495 /ORGANISM="Dactyliosolen fragilissimus" /LENGTH=502 /DNA_ID=CAMNT_0027360489 /DNA_START=231 /DNA_END=1739 /DNA_ORIENTATION=+
MGCYPLLSALSGQVGWWGVLECTHKSNTDCKGFTCFERHHRISLHTIPKEDDIEHHYQTCLRQFRYCPHFIHNLKDDAGDREYGDGDTLDEVNSSSANFLDKMDRMEKSLDEATRHLCDQNCYLRSRAPMRAWHELRCSVISFLNNYSSNIIMPDIDTLLEGWSCNLLPEDEFDHEDSLFVGKRVTETRKKWYVRIAYISPNGKHYLNISQVLKALETRFKSIETNSENAHYPRCLFHDYTSQSKCERRFNFACEASLENTHSKPCVGDYFGAEKNISMMHHRNSFHSCVHNESNNISIKTEKEESRKGIHISRDGNSIRKTIQSPFGLLEELFYRSPWKLIVSTILLNRTRRTQVDVIMFRFLDKWPTARDVANSNPDKVAKLIEPLGLSKKRAHTLIRFSREFLTLIDIQRQVLKLEQDKCTVVSYENRVKHCNNTMSCDENDSKFLTDTMCSFDSKDILHLYGCGQYASDAYDIFIKRRLPDGPVMDHALRYYVEYKFR